MDPHTFSTKTFRHFHQLNQLIVDLLVRFPQNVNEIFSLLRVGAREKCVRGTSSVGTGRSPYSMNVIFAGRRVININHEFYVTDI